MGFIRHVVANDGNDYYPFNSLNGIPNSSKIRFYHERELSTPLMGFREPPIWNPTHKSSSFNSLNGIPVRLPRRDLPRGGLSTPLMGFHRTQDYVREFRSFSSFNSLNGIRLACALLAMVGCTPFNSLNGIPNKFIDGNIRCFSLPHFQLP